MRYNLNEKISINSKSQIKLYLNSSILAKRLYAQKHICKENIKKHLIWEKGPVEVSFFV